jgi:serine/threonine protein kinase
VHLAEDRELHRLVAIKVLNTPDVAEDLRNRMVREAQIIARLEHPGIVPVHDVGTLPDGRVYYAMKFVRGSRLDEYAAQGAPLRDRLRKFQAVCDARLCTRARRDSSRSQTAEHHDRLFGEVLVLDWELQRSVMIRVLRVISNDGRHSDRNS